MHKIRALCPLIRTKTLQNATTGRGGNVNGYIQYKSVPVLNFLNDLVDKGIRVSDKY